MHLMKLNDNKNGDIKNSKIQLNSNLVNLKQMIPMKLRKYLEKYILVKYSFLYTRIEHGRDLISHDWEPELMVNSHPFSQVLNLTCKDYVFHKYIFNYI